MDLLDPKFFFLDSEASFKRGSTIYPDLILFKMVAVNSSPLVFKKNIARTSGEKKKNLVFYVYGYNVCLLQGKSFSNGALNIYLEDQNPSLHS